MVESEETSFRGKAYTWEEMQSWAEASVAGAFKRFLETGRTSWINSVSVEQVVVVRSYWGAGMDMPGIPEELKTGREIAEVFDMDGNLIAREDPYEMRKIT